MKINAIVKLQQKIIIIIINNLPIKKIIINKMNILINKIIK